MSELRSPCGGPFRESRITWRAWELDKSWAQLYFIPVRKTTISSASDLATAGGVIGPTWSALGAYRPGECFGMIGFCGSPGAHSISPSRT